MKTVTGKLVDRYWDGMKLHRFYFVLDTGLKLISFDRDLWNITSTMKDKRVTVRYFETALTPQLVSISAGE